MKTKLTLRLDDLTQQAKQQAKRRGTSVSQMVAACFALLSREPQSVETDNGNRSPFTQSLLGAAAGADLGSEPKAHREAYYRHLGEKHR